MRAMLIAGLCLAGMAGAAEAQVRVPIQAPVVSVAPGDSIAGRRVEATGVDPACLVTRGTDGRTSTLFFASSRWGEHAAIMTPALGRCARPQNPYPARIVVFDRVEVAGNVAVFRRGTLRCVIGAQGDVNSAQCNRPLRCDLSKHRCVNP